MPAQPPLPSIFRVIFVVEYLAGAVSDLDLFGPILRHNRHSVTSGQPPFALGEDAFRQTGRRSVKTAYAREREWN